MTDEKEQIVDAADHEDSDDSGIIYDINTSGADFDVDGLIKRFARGDIYRPAFQRNFVWSHPEASKFIESILLGLPVPSVFFYREEETNKLLIIDGLQRLTTLVSFVEGSLPGSGRVFKLTKLKSKFDGLTYKDLAEEDRRRFDDTIIHAFVINQTAPKEDHSAIYHIFDRINSNGKPLQPQEMRAAIYHGKLLELIEELNELPEWRSIFGPIHKRSKDSELILRFFALYFGSDEYKSPINSFLNSYLQANRNLEIDSESDLRGLFSSTMQRIHQAVGDLPFRPTRALNVAFYDAFSVAVARNKTADQSKIRSAYEALPKNEEFMGLISDTTSSPSNVKRRIELAEDALT